LSTHAYERREREREIEEKKNKEEEEVEEEGEEEEGGRHNQRMNSENNKTYVELQEALIFWSGVMVHSQKPFAFRFPT